jgi:hypothetical protein
MWQNSWCWTFRNYFFFPIILFNRVTSHQLRKWILAVLSSGV